MTQEQIDKLIEAIQRYEVNYALCVYVNMIAIIVLTLWVGFEIIHIIKIKKWIKEYKATLNQNQLKAINDLERIKK